MSRPGDDLAALIADAAPWLADGDVARGDQQDRVQSGGSAGRRCRRRGPERDAAREAVLTAETARVVARRGPTRIVQTHHGFVMAAAGIDASNVDPSRLVLLPEGSGRLGPRVAGGAARADRARRRRRSSPTRWAGRGATG